MITYSLAEAKDLEIIIELLQSVHLPFGDVHDSEIEFIVAKNDSEIIGCIGLEKYGRHGLLRSFVVKESFQNKGIGQGLYRQLLAFAGKEKVTTLHLLTTTASSYFSRMGFVEAKRNEAPELIGQTKEFSSLCPASSVYMTLEGLLK
ncbi:MAG TPA: arsenic resistance N-acetyltransferase ArsN2 [Bacteroidales bacterium]|nr:arsenic resistance N-acetyltransferase ArsN2 [Bacteroidales bacterium]